MGTAATSRKPTESGWMRHPDADSWYEATRHAAPSRSAMDGPRRFDVAIVGAGYTGLSTALHLAERGYKVAVLEAERVAFGASGRNGGQVSTGQRRGIDEIAQTYGPDAARNLWSLAEEAKLLVRDIIERHSIDCDLTPRIIDAGHNGREAEGLRHYVDHLQTVHGYTHARFLEGDAFRAVLNSPAYAAGILDDGGFHLHPLNYALGLARAAEAQGAKVFEQVRVHAIRPGAAVRLETSAGEVRADAAILACNGYLDDLAPTLANRIMPLNNFIVATEPLGDDAQALIPSAAAVADTRFVINYFRLSTDARLLFGGGETYSFRFPADIKAFVRPHLLGVFPSLKNARLDYGWGGTLAITRPRLPCFVRLEGNLLAACGYSGHGISIGTLAGRLLAEAIAGQTERFDVMAKIAPPPFPGGTMLRLPLLVLATLWYRLRDRL